MLTATSADARRGGFISLAAALRVNATGTLTFNLNADNEAVPLLENDGQVELWYAEALLMRFLYQEPRQYAIQNTGKGVFQELFTATCYGEKDLLNRYAVLWKAGVINRTVFTGMRAETILHTLVKYNATSDATTANGRMVTVPSPLISVEPDLGRGALLPQYDDMAGKPLLEALQEIARLGKVDFDLIQTSGRAWSFRVFDPVRGTDQTARLVFSRSRRNVGQLEYNPGPQDPRSIVVVAGPGEGIERPHVVRYGPEYSTENHREYFHSHGAEGTTTAALQAAGDEVLEQKRIKTSLTIQPLQVASARFGIDYGLGDLVRGEHRDLSTQLQVVGVALSMNKSGPPEISVEFEQR